MHCRNEIVDRIDLIELFDAINKMIVYVVSREAWA